MSTAYYDIPEGALVAGAPISIPLLETERDKEDKEIVQTVERLAVDLGRDQLSMFRGRRRRSARTLERLAADV